MRPFCIRAPLLTPLSEGEAAWHPEGAIAIDGKGIILFAGNAEELPDTYRNLPVTASVDIHFPSFIDMHVHLPQLDCRGRYGKSLLQWLNDIVFPVEERFEDGGYARETARAFFDALKRAGTTTAAVFLTVHEHAADIAFEEAERSGLRVIMGKMMSDRGVCESMCENPTESVAATERLIRKWHRKTDKLCYAVSPRFAPACSGALLAACGRLASRYDVYVQSHINENLKEIELVKQLFPERRSYADVYRDAGLLGAKTILGHNLHSTPEEYDVLSGTDTAIAHCPDSNLFLGSGRFPLERHLERGIRFGLGSDVGAGTTLSMLHVMKTMSYAQGRSLPPALPFYSATLGAARALSLQDRIGSLSNGKQADMLAFSLDETYRYGKPLQQLTVDDVLSAIVFQGRDENIQSVYVGGEPVYSRE